MLGGEALGFGLLGGEALGFGLLGGEALGFGLLGGEALGFGLRQCFGGEALGFGLLGGEALGFGLLGGEALGFGLRQCFGGEALGFGLRFGGQRLLGGEALGLGLRQCFCGEALGLGFLLAADGLGADVGERHDRGLVGRVQGSSVGVVGRATGGLELGLGVGQLGSVALPALGVPRGALDLLDGAGRLLLRHRHHLLAWLGCLEQGVVRGGPEQRRERLRDAVQTAGDLVLGDRLQVLRGAVGAGTCRRRCLDRRRGGERGSEAGHRGGRRRSLGTDHDLLDLEQARADEGVHDLPGFEQREAALLGEVGDAAHPIHLAQQRPRLGVDRHLGVGLAGGGQDRYGVRAVQDLGDALPHAVPLSDVREQLLHGGGGRDVLAGALVDAELPRAGRPAQQVGGLLTYLLVHERLDDRLIDVPQVDEELPEAPALELGPLRLECLGQALRSERAAGHQPGAELRAAAGHVDGVHLAAA